MKNEEQHVSSLERRKSLKRARALNRRWFMTTVFTIMNCNRNTSPSKSRSGDVGQRIIPIHRNVSLWLCDLLTVICVVAVFFFSIFYFLFLFWSSLQFALHFHLCSVPFFDRYFSTCARRVHQFCHELKETNGCTIHDHRFFFLFIYPFVSTHIWHLNYRSNKSVYWHC